MDDELAIYQTRPYQIIMGVLLLVIIIASARMVFIPDPEYLPGWRQAKQLYYVAFTGVLIWVLLDIVQKVRHKKPVAILKKSGVQAENGAFFPWSEVTNISPIRKGGIHIGVTSSKVGVVRLDGGIVGYRVIKQAREYLKANAPLKLTMKL